MTGVAAETAPRPTEPAPVPARRRGHGPGRGARHPPVLPGRPVPQRPAPPGGVAGLHQERVRRGSRAAERGPHPGGEPAAGDPSAATTGDRGGPGARLERRPSRPEAVGHDPAPGAQDPGARLGPGHREDLGLLLRAVRPAPEHLRGVAGRLRPHRARLLPARLHAPGIGAQHSRAAAVRLHADRVLAGDLPARHPTPAAGTTVEPVPAGAAALPPPGQPVDDGAVLHEVSHNLQNELQLERVVPLAILRRLRGGGVPDGVGRVWARWNREIFGDMLG